MKLCSTCVQRKGYLVPHPQMLLVRRGCTCCNDDKRMSWLEDDIILQLKMIKDKTWVS